MSADTSKPGSWIAVAVFVILLSMPLAAQVFSRSSGGVSDLENRTLAARPPLPGAPAAWIGFPEQMDAWLEDHFGFRAELIALHADLRDGLRLESTQHAVRGDEGWLFATTDEALAMHRGTRQWRPGETRKWLSELDTFNQRAQANGADFLVFVAPNKHSVYPEFLSAYPRRISGPRPVESLLAGQHAFPVIYPLEQILEARLTGLQPYYQTDTHWTSSGAFVGYQALMDTIEAAGIQPDRLSPDDVFLGPLRQHVGDIYGLLGVTPDGGEEVPSLLVRGRTKLDRLDLETYSWGSFAATHTRRGDGLRVLVYGDSFFYALAPFLEQSVGEVTFAHHRLGNPPLSLMEEGDYDLVILFMVERALTYPLQVR